MWNRLQVMSNTIIITIIHHHLPTNSDPPRIATVNDRGNKKWQDKTQ